MRMTLEQAAVIHRVMLDPRAATICRGGDEGTALGMAVIAAHAKAHNRIFVRSIATRATLSLGSHAFWMAVTAIARKHGFEIGLGSVKDRYRLVRVRGRSTAADVIKAFGLEGIPTKGWLE